MTTTTDEDESCPTQQVAIRRVRSVVQYYIAASTLIRIINK